MIAAHKDRVKMDVQKIYEMNYVSPVVIASGGAPNGLSPGNSHNNKASLKPAIAAKMASLAAQAAQAVQA